MKPVVAVFGLFVMLAFHVIAEHDLGDIVKVMELCKNKTGLSDEAAKNFKPHQVPQTHDEQCYLACINHELGHVFPNNTMNLERVKQFYAGLKTVYPDQEFYEKSIKVAEICATKVTANSDDCAAAKINMECYVDEANKIGLKIPGQ